MTIVGFLLTKLLSYWSWFLVVAIIGLSIKLLLGKKKDVVDPFLGIPEVKPHWFWGNLGSIFGEEHFAKFYDKHYKAMKGLRFCTWYDGSTKKFFMLDPDLINKIQVADFDHFMDLAFTPEQYIKAAGVQVGIADATGENWRQIKRIAANPFSMLKVKKQIPMFNDVFQNMVTYIGKQADSKAIVDGTDFIKMLSIDMIGYVGLGVQVNSFQNPDSEFRNQANNLVETWRFLLIALIVPVASFFKMGAWNPKAAEFFEMIGKQAIQSRKRGKIEGKDVLGSLVKANEEEPDVMTDEMLKFTIINLIVDGYNTISDALTNLLYLLAVHPEVQVKAQSEIDAIFEEKDNEDENQINLNDADIGNLNYVEMVIQESVRYVNLAATFRRCTKPWKIPDTNIIIPVGADIVIPIFSLHRDPEYWEDPEEFIPERFSPENKAKIRNGTYQPFGQGPRQCLGYNYVRYVIKLTVAYLLRNFNIENPENLPKKFDFNPETFLPTPKDALKVRFTRRT